ncbi:PP2C family protein-serine/threonine phosphatase [Streptomyces sp. TS71-3]|uniref:PP2C family protein-serine/threonine phosphatase n=1 Tax=Streptomyces sp. TS71-3 TaxID=2733862 RepID=UPI001BB3C144|nr:PP2C family protein-serine/threonine phosphatase [Streptomyces sp. TS71-3]
MSHLVGPARPGSRVYISAGDQQLAAAGGRWIGLTRLLVRLAPWVLLAGGLFFDATLPVRYSAVPIFVAAPLIAAPFYQMRFVLIVNAIAVIGVLVRNIERMSIDAPSGITQLSTCVVVTLLAVVINRVVRRGETLLVSAREIASAAQRAVLPEPAERIAGLEVAARYEAAQAGASIGGDFYAVQDTPRGVRVLVGDVRGKGMGAVSAVAVLIGAFREAAEQETSLEAVAQRLDRALAREAAMRRGDEAFEEFATAVFAEIPHGGGAVRIVNRGHPWPLILYADGALLEVATDEGSLPLGMSELGAWPPQPQNLTFPRGATLLMFTDGVTEARDAQGVFFDPTASLSGQIVGAPGRLLNVVVDEVRRHTAGAGEDDLALLAVRRP